MGLVWFLDSGASFHMTGDKDLFSDLEEKDLGVHIKMGNDGRYSATRIDTISFERESGMVPHFQELHLFYLFSEYTNI